MCHNSLDKETKVDCDGMVVVGASGGAIDKVCNSTCMYVGVYDGWVLALRFRPKNSWIEMTSRGGKRIG